MYFNYLYIAESNNNTTTSGEELQDDEEYYSDSEDNGIVSPQFLRKSTRVSRPVIRKGYISHLAAIDEVDPRSVQ